MSSAVTVLVVFPSREAESVAGLAAERLRALQASPRPSKAAAHFALEAAEDLLTQISSGIGFSRGPRGGTFACGTVTSHVEVDDIVAGLRTFWQELLWGAMERPDWRGPDPDTRILVLYQWDYAERAGARQIELLGADHQEDWLGKADHAGWRPDLRVTAQESLPISLF